MKENKFFYYNDLSFIINKDKKTVTCVLDFFEEGRYYYQQTLKGELVIPSIAIDKRNGKKYLVTKIGVEAFFCCKGLTSVFIPNSITEIGENAFHGCNGLNSIIVDSDNPNYDSRENCNALIETHTDTLITGCNNTIIPSSVRKIADGAFWDCSGLTSLVISKSVDRIGINAFYGCSSLISIKVEEGNRIYDSRGDCNALIETETNTLIVGSNNTVVPSSITKIENEAFEGRSGIKSVVIPDSVTEMGVSAFAGCTGLTEVKISGSLKIIDESAFACCENLTEVTIPDSVTHIYDCAFSGCTKLTVINFGSSVIDIWEDAFKNTAWFNKQPNGMVYAGSVAYRYKGEMTDETATIKEGCKSISDAAFKGCHQLKKIIIPDTVKLIGVSAFEDCKNLKTVNIPDSVSKIGIDTFKNCTSLKSVVLPDSITEIGWHAFDGCTNVHSIFCKMTNPSSIFELPNDETKLYIPKGSFEAYKSLGFDENQLVELTDEEIERRIAELKGQKN